MQKNLEIREGRREQWTWNVLFLSREFSCEHSQRFLPIFIMLCSYFQNNECKKSSNSRGKTSAMKSQFYSMEFFPFFHKNFPVNIHSDFFLFFIMLCQYFLNNECRKNFEIREETLKQWKPTSTQPIWQKHCQLNRLQFQPLNSKVQHVLYGMRKRPSHGKSVPRKQCPTHGKSVRGASSDAKGASTK